MTESIGWIGVIAYVTAYALLTMGYMKSDRVSFHLLNMVGGICLVIIAYEKSDLPNLFVNIIWGFIAFCAIVRLLLVRHWRRFH